MALFNVEGKYDFIAIGCSVGGIEALKHILEELPRSFPVPIGVVQHRAPDSKGIMIRYFREICQLEVCEPDDKEPIVCGKIYFAPANYHMMVSKDFCFNLTVDDPIHYSRPSVDVFMESVAEIYKARAIGIIMSGANADGADGLRAMKDRGALAIIQDPSNAFHEFMPRAAMNKVKADHVLDLDQIKSLFHSFYQKGALV